MNKIIDRVLKEFYEILPPTIFFFIAFSLIILTKSLILEQYGIEFTNFAAAVIGALIVGKIVLIIDKFSFINMFPNKPLIHNVLWKTTIYILAALLVRYLEHLFSLYSKADGLLEAHHMLVDAIIWPHFWLIQMWLLILFLVYTSLRELVRALGRENIMHMFFGRDALINR